MMTVKLSALDASPPGAGLKTVTLAVPAAATSAAVIVAVSCVLLTKVVVRSPPFHLTTEVLMKLVPVTVSVNAALPAAIPLGLKLASVGAGLSAACVTVKVCGPMVKVPVRALPVLLPKAVDDIEDYYYADGEVVAGLVIGWNFGDGHLHDEQLLRAVQEQCNFEAGELRCLQVESQPLGRGCLAWRIHDAKNGLLESGEISIAEMQSRQPWTASAAD